MPSRRRIGLIAVAAPFWFAAVYLILSSRRPEFSHLTKAVSELGSLDAPDRWLWHVLGYIVPGLAVALLGIGLNREFSARPRYAFPALALTASGLLMAMSGVFPGDFENRTSTTMMLHTVASLGSFAAFLVAGLWLPRAFRSVDTWRWLAWPSLTLVVASVLAGFLRSGDAPGLGQRVGFALFFAWVGMVGYALWRSGRAGSGPATATDRGSDA